MSKIFESTKNGTGHFTYAVLYKIGGIGASLDSAYVIGSLLLAYFESQFNDLTIAAALTVPIVLAYLIAVDWALFVFLPNTLKGMFSKVHTKVADAHPLAPGFSSVDRLG